MGQNYTITLACRNSDGTNAILRGSVRPEGIDLRATEINDVPKLFTAMFRGEYHVAEMSLAELVYYVSRDQSPFIGIPVFPSRVFRHGYILCNAASGIRTPQSLDGKRIGSQRWVQTADVWNRGMVAEEYGISPQRTQWYVWDIHHWQGEASEIQTRDGSVIHRFERSGHDEYDGTCLALLEGTVDALLTTENQRYSVLLKDKRIRRLFETPAEVEAAFYRKTKIFPIMHTLVARKDAIERHPDLPPRLFDLFSRSKKLGQESMQMTPSLALAWKNRYLEMEREIFQGDPWAYGLEKNRGTLQKFLSYCYAQGVSARQLRPEELFIPSTWNLSE